MRQLKEALDGFLTSNKYPVMAPDQRAMRVEDRGDKCVLTLRQILKTLVFPEGDTPRGMVVKQIDSLPNVSCVVHLHAEGHRGYLKTPRGTIAFNP